MLLCNVAEEVLTGVRRVPILFFLVVASAYFINTTLDLRKDSLSHLSILCDVSHKTREYNRCNHLTEHVYCDNTMKRK